MIDTTNRAIVGAQGDRVVMLRNPSPMTREEAIVVAAYLLAMAACAGKGGSVDAELAQARRAIECGTNDDAGLCAACEAMPTGADGRAAFCPVHR